MLNEQEKGKYKIDLTGITTKNQQVTEEEDKQIKQGEKNKDFARELIQMFNQN